MRGLGQMRSRVAFERLVIGGKRVWMLERLGRVEHGCSPRVRPVLVQRARQGFESVHFLVATAPLYSRGVRRLPMVYASSVMRLAPAARASRPARHYKSQTGFHPGGQLASS